MFWMVQIRISLFAEAVVKYTWETRHGCLIRLGEVSAHFRVDISSMEGEDEDCSYIDAHYWQDTSRNS